MVASLLRKLPKKTQARCKFWFHTVRFWPNCPVCLHLEVRNRKTHKAQVVTRVNERTCGRLFQTEALIVWANLKVVGQKMSRQLQRLWCTREL